MSPRRLYLTPTLDFEHAVKNGLGGWSVLSNDGHLYVSKSSTSVEPPPQVDGPRVHEYYHAVGACEACKREQGV